MRKSLNLLAFDLTPEKGRALLGQFDGLRLSISEVHRFTFSPVQVLQEGPRWDILSMWNEILRGISLAAKRGPLSGIGIDSWGGDFALLDRQGALIGNPSCYREGKDDKALEKLLMRVPREEVYASTGSPAAPGSALTRLFAMVESQSPTLQIAQTFLALPDLFNYWMTGRMVCEFTNAVMTQCFNPVQKDWARPLMERLSIPTGIFPKVVPAGTIISLMSPSLADTLGIDPIPVITPASHNNGSSVAAIPASVHNFAWIHLDDYTVFGMHIPRPLITAKSQEMGLSNEGGAKGNYRLSKKMVGLWLAQECKASWARQGEDHPMEMLARFADNAEPLQSVIDPDHAIFANLATFAKPINITRPAGLSTPTSLTMPVSMPDRIRSYCARTGQPVPNSKGAVMRCVLESLAFKYRWILEQYEVMLNRRVEMIHIIGAGASQRVLCQYIANATGRPVVSGPSEATAFGNLLMQSIALDELNATDDGYEVLRNSGNAETFTPSGGREWDEMYAKFVKQLKY